MPDDYCHRLARAPAVSVNSVGVIEIEGRIRWDLQLCPLLFKQVTIVGRNAKFVGSALGLTNTFQKVRTGAQTRGHESMKRKRVSHDQRRDHNYGGGQQAETLRSPPPTTRLHKPQKSFRPAKYQLQI